MKKAVTFGEVLLRLSTKEYLKFSQATEFNADFGGSELNVAVTLANFGMEVDYITRLPENDIANCAIMQMRKHNVGSNHIVRGGDRLGVYFLEKGASARGSKIVYDRENSSLATIKIGMINWENVFKDCNWFHWSGITAGVSQDAADVCLEAIEVANKLGITVSTDFNYRANLWKFGKSPSEIMETMVAKSQVILAGDYASKQYFNINPEGNTEKEIHLSLCQKLKERFPNVQKIAVTHRVSIDALDNIWSGILYDGSKLYESKTYTITNIVDRIGTGDSFMGALIYGLNHFDDQKALEFAVAASCLKHTVYGDANLVSRKEVENLIVSEQIGLVNR